MLPLQLPFSAATCSRPLFLQKGELRVDDENQPPSNARKRPITRVPQTKYVRKTRRDRLLANGLRPPKVRGDEKKKRKRGRPKKPGAPRKYREDPNRLSPSHRKGARFHTVSVPEEAYAMLKEMSLFYKKSLARVVEDLIKPAFDKAYQESLTLARIAANKEKARATEETSDDSDPPRRTHF